MSEIKVKDIGSFDKASLYKAKSDVSAQLTRTANEISSINAKLKEKQGTNPMAIKMTELAEIDSLKAQLLPLQEERATLEKMLAEIDARLDELKLVKKERSLANVRYLLKKFPNAKLGQIEAEGGVSTGYTSRMEKSDSKADPPVEYLAAAAKAFDISIDTLIYVPLDEMTASEQYVIKFIEKVAADTTVENMIWEREPGEFLNNEVEVNGYGAQYHPLLVPNKNDMDGYGNFGSLVFESRFFPEKCVRVMPDPYHATMTGTSSVLYIVPVIIQEDTPPDAVSGYELYIYDSNEVTPICNTTQSHPAIASAVTKLYSLIKETTAHVRLDKKARSLIDAFMNPQQKKSPFDELEDDGELPF